MNLIKRSPGTCFGMCLFLIGCLSGIATSTQAQENQPPEIEQLALYDFLTQPPRMDHTGLFPKRLNLVFPKDLIFRFPNHYVQEINALARPSFTPPGGEGMPFNTSTYTILASAEANGQISPMGAVEVTAFSNQAFLITPDPGFEIADVLVDGVSVGVTEDFTFGFVLSDHTIHARFQAMAGPSQFTIRASAGANGQISPQGNVAVNQGENQTFNISPEPGFEIADVLVDGVSVGTGSSYTFSQVDSDHQIEAQFQPPPAQFFSIQASAAANGRINPSGNLQVSAGSNQAFSIMADPGFEIADVLVDGVSVGAVSDFTFGQVARDHQIQAHFRALSRGTFFITTESGPQGQISPAGTVSVNAGEDQVFQIVPDVGFEVAEVWIDGNSVAAPETYTFRNVQADHLIRASFQVAAPAQYIIQANAGPNGSISPQGDISLNAGSSQIFFFNPNPGYELAEIRVDGETISLMNSYEFVNVQEDHRIDLSFALIPVKPEAPQLVVNNQFTPNGDGFNDTWQIEGLEDHSQYHIQVFAKNGEAVFETHHYLSPWDGTFKGQKLEAGVYYYSIALANQDKTLNGYVLLVR